MMTQYEQNQEVMNKMKAHWNKQTQIEQIVKKTKVVNKDRRTARGTHMNQDIYMVKKHYAKERGLGYHMLNAPFPGCCGHHINREQVVNILPELNIPHNVFTGRGMEEMNKIALDWCELNNPIKG